IGTPVFSVGGLVAGGTVTVTATWNDAPGGSAYDNISKSFVVPAGVQVMLVGFGSDSTSDPGPGGQCRLNSGANLGVLTNDCALHSTTRAALGSYTVHAVQQSDTIASDFISLDQTPATINLTISASPPTTPDAVTAPALTVQVLGNGSGQVAVFELLNFGTEFDSRAGGVITMTDTFDFGTKSFFSYIAVAQPDAGSTLSGRDCAVVGMGFNTDYRVQGNAVIPAGALGVARSALVANNACSIGLLEQTTSTDHTISFTFTDPNAPVTPTVTIAADNTSVTEGADATFTITTDTAPAAGATLVVNVGTSQDGTFIDGTPPTSVTIAESATTAVLTVATDDDSTDEPNGSITATITDNSAYTTGTASSASITVEDNDDVTLPVVSVTYAGQTSGNQMCGTTPGVCEGDTIVYTITAEPMPTTDLSVRLGRLAAGEFGIFYGIPGTADGDANPDNNPTNYAIGGDDRGGRVVTILANTSSITHEVPTANLYGSGILGGYFVEVNCLDESDGATGCLTDDTIANEYTMVATTRGGDQTAASALTPAQSHCDGGASGNGDESSECFVHIIPVTTPEMSVATTTNVAEFGDMVTFTITADKAPNHYNTERTAFAALPVTIAVTQGGSTLAGAATTVDMGAGASSTTAEITAGAMAIGSPMELTLVASADTPTRYSVSATNASATVPLTEDANASTKPIVDLAAASDTHNTTVSLGAPGTDSDNITKNRTPTITVTNVVNTGMVVVMATHASATAVSITGTAAGVTIDLALPTLADGVWSVTAMHTDGVKTPATSDPLEITIDRTDPVVTIVDPGTAPAMSKTYVATDDEAAGNTVMKTRGQADGNCPTFPPTGGTADYMEGADLVLTSEGENGRYVCFYSTDLADNRSRRAILIGGIDTTGPTVSFTPASPFVDVGGTVTITITTNEATTDLVATDITTDIGSLAGFTANSATEYEVTLTPPASPGTATLTIAADAFTDPAGNGNAAVTQAVTIQPAGDPDITIADAAAVAEGSAATFTISSSKNVGADLVIMLGATDSVGMFLGANPPTMATITMNTDSVDITVPTRDGTGGNGTITVTLTDGADYNLGAMSSASATVRDIPLVTLDFVGQASGTKTCEASARTNKGGVCEGDSIVFILNADPAPDANLVVPIGRLEAGDSGSLVYGLTAPYNEYIDNSEDGGALSITIPAGQRSVRRTLTTVNRYGLSNVGGMYYELIGNPTDYKFNAEDRGQFDPPNASGANPSNCPTDADAMSDNNEDSECLVVIHPVAAPAISIAAVDTSVAAGAVASFTLTGTGEPNYYSGGARAAVPVSVTITQGGNALAGAPATVSMGASDTTANVYITSGAAAGTPLEVTITNADGYSVGATASASIMVAAAAADASATPGAPDLVAGNRGDNRSPFRLGVGSDTDNITNVNTPAFTVGGVSEGEVVITARHATADAVSATGTVGAGESSVEIVVGTSTAPLADGTWSFTAVQTETGMSVSPASTALQVIIDASPPVITLGLNPSAPALQQTYTATATGGDAGGTALTMHYRFRGDDACDYGVGSYTAYTPGSNLVRTSVTDATDYICFYATDQGGNSVFQVTNQVVLEDPPLPMVTIADAGRVVETFAATFTISSNAVVTADLTVTLTVADTTGSFLGASPPMMAVIPMGDDSVAIAVPTQDSSGGDGTITVTLTTDNSVYDLGAMSAATVTVRDLPVVTIDFHGQSSGDRTCEAATRADGDGGKSGICEGERIVVTITANPAPTGNLDVRLGRLEAGVFTIP
ncbi:MAG: beta strand repeat-containing protein, partial [Pseudohongiellaceae bacterium]